MTCSLCRHLSRDRYCPEARDVVPCEYVQKDNQCPFYASATPEMIIDTIIETGPLLGPLWTLRDLFEGIIYIDDDRRDIAIQRLIPHQADRRIAFIVEAALSHTGLK